MGVWYYLKNRNYIIIKKNEAYYTAELYINNKKEGEINFRNLNDLIGGINSLLFENKSIHFIKLISNTNK